jgi:hypothetical protein
LSAAPTAVVSSSMAGRGRVRHTSVFAQQMGREDMKQRQCNSSFVRQRSESIQFLFLLQDLFKVDIIWLFISSRSFLDHAVMFSVCLSMRLLADVCQGSLGLRSPLCVVP